MNTATPTPAPRRRLWWALTATAALWLTLWLTPALLLPPPAPTCPPSSPRWRGVYHLHAVDHDGIDRSERARAAAQAACLDFLIVTDHNHTLGQLVKDDRTQPTILDGGEWTVGKHHHGQLWGRHHGERRNDPAAALRVLNHPTASGIHDLADLSDEELAAFTAGTMGLEIANAPRLATHTPAWRLAAALLAGPARRDLTFALLSQPAPARDLWVQLRTTLQQPVWMLCGSDAHGGMTPYDLFFSALVLHLPQVQEDFEPILALNAITQGCGVCVNEYLGDPGHISLHQDEGSLTITADLPPHAHWRLLEDGREIARGQKHTTLRPQPRHNQRRAFYHLELWQDPSLGTLPFASLWAIADTCRLPPP